MPRFIAGKIARSFIALGIVTVVMFGLSRLSGDPISLLLPSDASAAEIAAVRAQYGLDRPLAVQYLDFIGGILHGDFGRRTHPRPGGRVARPGRIGT